MSDDKNGNSSPKRRLRNYYLSLPDFKQAALTLRALNHNLRRQIIDLLEQEGPMTVTEVYKRLNLEQSVASHQLGILKRAGVVTADRRGKFIHYFIDVEKIEYIAKIVRKLVQ